MSTEQIQAHCKKLAFAGKDYAFIKAEVEAMDISEKEKIRIMIKADEYLVHYQVALQERGKALQQIVLGWSIMLIGLAIAIYSYYSALRRHYVLYGIAFAGYWILRQGYRAYRVPLEEIASPLDKVSGRRKRF